MASELHSSMVTLYRSITLRVYRSALKNRMITQCKCTFRGFGLNLISRWAITWEYLPTNLSLFGAANFFIYFFFGRWHFSDWNFCRLRFGSKFNMKVSHHMRIHAYKFELIRSSQFIYFFFFWPMAFLRLNVLSTPI
jgi:hypothetical protein